MEKEEKTSALQSLIDGVSSLVKNIFIFVVFVIIGGFIVWGGWKLLVKVADWVTPDEWTLMICSTKLNDYECADNAYSIPGFKSKKDCMLEGATRFEKHGFECGSNCRTDYGNLNVCKEVCNKGGCSK